MTNYSSLQVGLIVLNIKSMFPRKLIFFFFQLGTQKYIVHSIIIVFDNNYRWFTFIVNVIYLIDVFKIIIST